MQSTKSRRIVVTRRGGPEVMRFLDTDMPTPSRGEVRVRTATVGVSAYDATIRSTRLPGNPRPPFTPGEDVVGIVDAIGADVAGVELGQMVALSTFGGGGYATHLCAPADRVVPVPDGLDPVRAVAMVINYLTAQLYLHETASVRSGERALVHGAAGGLGSALIQLGHLAGLDLYCTASAHNHELLRSMGAVPIDYHDEDFVRRINDLTGDGVDVVFDTVGGFAQLVRSYRTLRRGGRLVPIGSVAVLRDGSRAIPNSLLAIGLLKLIPDGRSVPLTPTMMKFPLEHPDWYRSTLTELLDFAASGKLDPVIATRLPLADASLAHTILERGGHAGKVVLVADESLTR